MKNIIFFTLLVTIPLSCSMPVFAKGNKHIHLNGQSKNHGSKGKSIHGVKIVKHKINFSQKVTI